MIKQIQIKNIIKPGFLVFFASLILVCEIAGQEGRQLQPPPNWVLENNRQRQEFNKMSGVDNAGNISRTGNGATMFWGSSEKLSKKDRKTFAPLAVDFKTNAEFLKQPKAGIVRILDSFQCRTENSLMTAKVWEKCGGISALLFGNNFSFRANDHTFAERSDLSIKNGSFISHGQLVQTLIYNMGNYPLENVLATSKSFIALDGFVSAEKIEGVSDQFESLQKGLRIGNFYFKNSLPIVLNSTYILRSIAFKSPPNTAKTKNPFNSSEGNREDIILAFRVIRKDWDGSVTLLWKELSRKAAPELIYSENN